MNKTTKRYAIVGVAAVIVISLVVMSTGALDGLFGNSTQFTAVFLDENGKEVGRLNTNNFNPFSIISTPSGEVLSAGAKSMYFVLNVQNTGKYPWAGTIDSSTTPALITAFNGAPKTVKAGESGTWISTNISTTQYEGTIQSFYVKVKMTSSINPNNIGYTEKTVSYKIDPEEIPQGTITLVSSAGSGSGGFSETNTTGGGTTLKTSGTSCTAGSECQSGSCIAQNQNVVTSCSGMTLCPVTVIGSCSVTNTGGTVGSTCTPDNYCSCGGSYTTFKYTSSTTISSCA